MPRELVPVMSVVELSDFFVTAFPGGGHDRMGRIETIAPGMARLAMEPGPDTLRPGGIVSGPTQMAFADRAAYAVILAHIGPVAMAVTSNLNYSFLRSVEQSTVWCDAVLLKLGKRLATVDCRLWQDSPSNIVGQATVTYAIPA
jgi:acyl-coenzyme A thioesterase PaaI-like protein